MKSARNVLLKPSCAIATWRCHLLSWAAGAMLSFSPMMVRAQSGSDSFGSATVLPGGSGIVTGSNESATAQGGEPDHAENPAEASLWWRWTAPDTGNVTFSTAGSDFDTVLAVYEGTTLAGLILVADNDDSGDTYQSAVTFEATLGTSYLIAVDGYDGDTGTVLLSWLQDLNNDAFVDAVEIGGPSGSTLGTNIDATKEPGETDHAGEPGGASIWWQWTAPSDGEVTFDTFGSDFTTALAVYTGDDLGSLVEVASDVDYEPDSQSMVVFHATAGTSYRIVVDGVVWEPGLDPTRGTVVLRWGAPLPNDQFASALVIAGPSGTATGGNLGATIESGEPEHVDDLSGASVWWQWTSPGGGVVTFDTFGSNFDTILAVYTGDAVDALTLVADNDDDNNGESVQSLVHLAVAAETTYRIAVAGYEGDAGSITLNWTWTPLSDEPLQIEGATFLSDGSFRFVLRGPQGTSGSIERADALGDWITWLNFELGNEPQEFIDPDAGALGRRFYRAVSP